MGTIKGKTPGPLSSPPNTIPHMVLSLQSCSLSLSCSSFRLFFTGHLQKIEDEHD